MHIFQTVKCLNEIQKNKITSFIVIKYLCFCSAVEFDSNNNLQFRDCVLKWKRKRN